MDLSSLRERPERSELTVSELNSYIKRILDKDNLLSAVTVRGEISNFKRHSSGHLYFSLKDTEGQIKAVMFRTYADKLRFLPEDGMRVSVRASVSVYAQAGTYQLYVNSIQPDGIGALYLAYEQLKMRLSEEGLFDSMFKRPIPQYPSNIGVITSPTGAAVRDIINVCKRRYPLATVYVYPALVQGEGAEQTLIDGIDYFARSALADVIIIGRGGGSIEDLWAFNSEALARRIFACEIPIISAVGHETDFTICDFVADLRAPTPSAAAELACPDISELMLRVDGYSDRVRSALLMRVERAEKCLDAVKSSMILSQSDIVFEDREDRLEDMLQRAVRAAENRLSVASGALALAAGKANALSPLSTLARGYAVIYGTGMKAIKSSNDISLGDSLRIKLMQGELLAKVTDKK